MALQGLYSRGAVYMLVVTRGYRLCTVCAVCVYVPVYFLAGAIFREAAF